MNCYVLIIGWLFLSLPFCCLRKMTPFNLTLSPHLGTLTEGWVYSLSAPTLTAGNPSPRVYGGCSFGVYEGGDHFTDRINLNSALHHNQPRLRLGFDQLRGEPAILGLDLAFPPRPSSSLGIAHHSTFGPPCTFRLTSPWPGLDRPTSGITSVTLGAILHHTSGHIPSNLSGIRRY